MGYLSNLYAATMNDAYGLARSEIAKATGRVLSCGSGDGWDIKTVRDLGCTGEFCGIEWDAERVARAVAAGYDIVQGDLNKPLPFDDGHFECVYGLSVLEHILRPCAFIREAHRVLKPGGKLVLLTPNIATYFTALNILRGRMPSTGPHPDSNALAAINEYNVSAYAAPGVEGDTPIHRHLVVFSFSALRTFLKIVGFSTIEGKAFGHYPFPRFMQPALQRLDPWHCHQMVFVATK